MRFLDLELEDSVPDATTIWLFREALAQAGLIDKLFERFGQHLEAEGYIARGGQIIDATICGGVRQLVVGLSYPLTSPHPHRLATIIYFTFSAIKLSCAAYCGQQVRC